jgi:hypothetical protein
VARRLLSLLRSGQWARVASRGAQRYCDAINTACIARFLVALLRDSNTPPFHDSTISPRGDGPWHPTTINVPSAASGLRSSKRLPNMTACRDPNARSVAVGGSNRRSPQCSSRRVESLDRGETV